MIWTNEMDLALKQARQTVGPEGSWGDVAAGMALLGFDVTRDAVKNRAARLGVKHERPTGGSWQPGMSWNGTSGTITTGPLDDSPDWEQVLSVWNLDPEVYEVVEPVQFRAWDGPDPEGGIRRFFYYRASVRKRVRPTVDLDALIARLNEPFPEVELPVDTSGTWTYLVAVADPQLGKKGTAETVERFRNVTERANARLVELTMMKGSTPKEIILCSLGDVIEGCDSHYCVSANTPVLTDDLRWVPAGSLKEGDGLYSLTEEAVSIRGRRYEKATVLANVVEPLEVVRVTLDNGESIVCTPEHPLLSAKVRAHGQGKSAWVSASDLTTSHRIAKMFDVWEPGRTAVDGWMGGILLIGKVGTPMAQAKEWPRVVSVEREGVQPVARMSTSSRTFFAAGYASHNSMQTFEVELDRRSQVRLARTLFAELIRALAYYTIPLRVAAVAGNHGENRRNGKAFTSFGDNDDLAVFEQLSEVFAADPQYQHVQFHVPDNDLTLVVETSLGLDIGLAHGHQAKNGDIIKWWRDQTFGWRGLHEADILLTGHFHHLAVRQIGPHTWFQVPTLDSGSQWFAETSGEESSPGILTMTLNDRGWHDLQLLGGA